MLIDKTDGALEASRKFSSERSAETRTALEAKLLLLAHYHYTDKETYACIENTKNPHEFFVAVHRITDKGPRLLDTFSLRYIEPELLHDDITPTARVKPTYSPGWVLLSSGGVVRDTPYRRRT